MKESKNIVSAAITTNTKETAYSDIGEKVWIVYYYLLSLSHYNNNEEHRFVYRNEFNVTQMSKALGISRATFYNAIAKLEKKEMIRKSHAEDYFIIPIKRGWAKLSKDLLVELLGYCQVFSVDLLRTYLFLKVIYEMYGPDKCFTKRNIVRCLGHNDQGSAIYKRIEGYLAMLSEWKLIFLSQHSETSELGEVTVYNVLSISDSSKILDSYLRERKAENKNALGLSAAEEQAAKENL